MKENAATIAVIFAILENIPYLRDVIRKKTHPHPYPFFYAGIQYCNNLSFNLYDYYKFSDDSIYFTKK